MLSSRRIVASIDRLHRLHDIVQAMLLDLRLHGYTVILNVPHCIRITSHPGPQPPRALASLLMQVDD